MRYFLGSEFCCKRVTENQFKETQRQNSDNGNVWFCRLGVYTDCVFTQGKSLKHIPCFKDKRIYT